MNFRICSVLLCVLSASQLAAQERQVSDLKPATVTTTDATTTTEGVLESDQCNPTTQAMLMAPSDPLPPAGELLIGADVDPNNPEAVLPLFVPEETKFEWRSVGNGKEATLRLHGMELVIFLNNWEVANDTSELRFNASLLHYQFSPKVLMSEMYAEGYSIAQMGCLYLGMQEVQRFLGSYEEIPLRCLIYSTDESALALSFGVDRTLKPTREATDPPVMRQRILFMDNGNVITLSMADTCACCSRHGNGAACDEDEDCRRGASCGDDTANAYSCTFQTTGGEKEVFLGGSLTALGALAVGGLLKRR